MCDRFPTTVEYIDNKLDLNACLIKHPIATFFVRVSGDSMKGAGIHSGDILIVDRAVEPISNCVVIASLDEELIVKRFIMDGSRLFLIPDNDEYKPIEIREEMSFEIWGVVSYSLHSLKGSL